MAYLSGFATWDFIAKEDLNAQKQALLLLIEDSACPETKDLVYFLWEKVSIRKFCSVKATDFRFKKSTFPGLLIVAICVTDLLAFTIA